MVMVWRGRAGQGMDGMARYGLTVGQDRTSRLSPRVQSNSGLHRGGERQWQPRVASSVTQGHRSPIDSRAEGRVEPRHRRSKKARNWPEETP